MLANGQDINRAGTDRRRTIEWPTVALAGTVYLLFGLLTWWHDVLPWWVIFPVAGYLVCLHGSLQHEAVHGHPTRWPLVNEALVFPSLWLWMPFRLYKESHLTHHQDANLTDPLDDPESCYVTPQAWAGMSRPRRAFLVVHNSLLGRLALGPFVVVWRLMAREGAALLNGDFSHGRAWAIHIAGAALVLVWVLGVCGIPLGEYLLLYVYPGLSLTLLRSFLEHRARPAEGERSVLIEAGPVMSLVFLNNNLHALHHAEPGVAWYRLPAHYRARRAELLALNGGYRYRNYLEIAARYLLRPKEPVIHPYAGRAA